jgi:hypothetical protein
MVAVVVERSSARVLCAGGEDQVDRRRPVVAAPRQLVPRRARLVFDLGGDRDVRQAVDVGHHAGVIGR